MNKELTIYDYLALEEEQPPQDNSQPQDGGQAQPSNGVEWNLENVQKFLAENEDAKKWQSSVIDSHFSKSLETWKKNNLEKEVEREIAKRYPAETEDQKKLRELQLKLDQMEAENKRKDLFSVATKKANEMGLPIEIVDFMLGADEESTMANIEKVNELFQNYVNKGVEAKFKQNGGTPAGTGQGNGLPMSEYEKARKAGDVKSMLKNKQIKN